MVVVCSLVFFSFFFFLSLLKNVSGRYNSQKHSKRKKESVNSEEMPESCTHKFPQSMVVTALGDVF